MTPRQILEQLLESRDLSEDEAAALLATLTAPDLPPAMAGALLTAAAVDRLVIFQAPCVLGAGALGAFAFAPARTPTDAFRLPVIERRTLDDDLMTVYACSPA